MRAFFYWAMKNSWNLFGAMGVIGTFYFSLAYVPGYVSEITSGNLNVVHESLMDDIQEMVFHEKELTIKDIESFIKGEELKYKVTYPFNPDELLIQVQESFMGNKFIPLEERNKILKNISSIRSNYENEYLNSSDEKGFFEVNYTTIASILASLLGVVLSVFGAVSLKIKNESDKQTEIDIAGDLVINSSGDRAASYYEFEEMVGITLSEAGFEHVNSEGNNDFGVDFSAKSNGSEYFVSVKKYKSLLGMSSLLPFLHTVSESDKNGIFVISSDVTKRVRHTIDEFNKNDSHQKMHLVIGDAKDLIKNQLVSILDKNASNK
ncbi:MAG: restriction endonuclease [Oleispira sp.]|nr:restriction endonuclease [Oleispira sp.]MBL4880874.1 restriction endonuclease [Oleispira sp.]